jgi:Tfp pilus assembly pilus retraction ATPase PilT
MIADSFFFVNLFGFKKCIINQKEVNKGTDSISLKLKKRSLRKS